jgi:opacity protein-like surface antigen
MKWFLVLLAVFAFTASAADVTGTWKASIETPNGNFETTFTFKVDGDKLTGKVSSQMGESDISEGKVDGDSLSFTVVRNFQGNEFKMNYKGKVTGNEMKLSFQFPGREEPFEMTAKKVS